MRDDEVLVGKKPTMNYVLAAISQLEKHKVCNIQARGKAISKAVDISQIVKNRFKTDATIEKVDVGTQTIQDNNKEKSLSSIIIVMKL